MEGKIIPKSTHLPIQLYITLTQDPGVGRKEREGRGEVMGWGRKEREGRGDGRGEEEEEGRGDGRGLERGEER